MGVSIGAGPLASNFPGGFSSGVTIRAMPVLNAYPRRTFWVNNNNPTASDSNRGTFDRPFATLGGAVSAAANGGTNAPLAGAGDLIMVGAGHAETVSSATALNISISGLQFVGLGVGGLRPTITLGTAATSTITVSAANVTFTNFLFVANFAAVASLFTLTTATDFGVFGCEFRDTTSVLNFQYIVTTDTTDHHADGLSISDCSFNGLGATANTALILCQGTTDRLQVYNTYVAHNATTQAGAMQIAAGKSVTHMQFLNNTFELIGANSTVGELISTNQTTNSGVLAYNFSQSLMATPVLVTASSGFIYFNNYHSDVADASGYLIPAADS